jgi:hypothetical protein
MVTKTELDEAIRASSGRCRGGPDCTCCCVNCDCGCRDECPSFRTNVLRNLMDSEIRRF